MSDFYVDFIVTVGVEAFGEDEDGCRYFFSHQSMRHTFFSYLGSLIQQHLGVATYLACLGDLMGSCGPIFLFEGFGRVVWTYLGLGLFFLMYLISL